MLVTAAWVRFELTKDFRPWRFSRPLPSTARPPRLNATTYCRLMTCQPELQGKSVLRVGAVVLGIRGTSVVRHREEHVVVPPVGIGVNRILLVRVGPIPEAPLPAHNAAVIVLALVDERARQSAAVHLEVSSRWFVGLRWWRWWRRRWYGRLGLRRMGLGISGPIIIRDGQQDLIAARRRVRV